MSQKARLLPRAVFAALVFFVVPAVADAPRGQYERFDSKSVTIKDTFTKLEWDRRSIVKSAQDLAGGACNGRPANPKYRLPTVKELLTILDEEPHLEYEFGKEVSKVIDQLAFPDTPVDLPYWTSSPAAGGQFWTLSFANGLMEPRPIGDALYVRCVR